ncbi:hypothetical protein H0H92_000917, partial [Tricholoma furcatifolium]
AGARCEGYFTTEDILEQVQKAITILAAHFTHEDHVFIYDNATTHLKRADKALSATQMPKGPSKSIETNFGVWVNNVGPDGHVQRDKDGKLVKKKVPMRNEKFADGTEQEFYYPTGYERTGIFKGMATILTERGYNCWGYAKRTYRLLPKLSRDEDLEKNVIKSLDEVPLMSMRRMESFATRSLRFMDAYRKGLNGLQATWAAKKYRGH